MAVDGLPPKQLAKQWPARALRLAAGLERAEQTLALKLDDLDTWPQPYSEGANARSVRSGG